LHDLNNAGLADITRVINEVTTFIDSLPQPFKDCVAANNELKVLGKLYGVDDTTDLDALKNKLIKYATLHFLKVKGWIKTADQEWSGKQYEKLGRDAAGWGHECL